MYTSYVLPALFVRRVDQLYYQKPLFNPCQLSKIHSEEWQWMCLTLYQELRVAMDVFDPLPRTKSGNGCV